MRRVYNFFTHANDCVVMCARSESLRGETLVSTSESIKLIRSRVSLRPTRSCGSCVSVVLCHRRQTAPSVFLADRSRLLDLLAAVDRNELFHLGLAPATAIYRSRLIASRISTGPWQVNRDGGGLSQRHFSTLGLSLVVRARAKTAESASLHCSRGSRTLPSRQRIFRFSVR